MATISENLQTIADSTAAIKQAIIDKGGTIEGDITTWASAISGLSGGGSGGSSEEENNFKFVINSYNSGYNASQDIIDNNISIYNFLIKKYGATGSKSYPTEVVYDTPKIFCSGFSQIIGQCIYIYIPTSLSYIYLYDAYGLQSYYCVNLTSDGRAESYFWD